MQTVTATSTDHGAPRATRMMKPIATVVTVGPGAPPDRDGNGRHHRITPRQFIGDDATGNPVSTAG
jgi:hypothetical protein